PAGRAPAEGGGGGLAGLTVEEMERRLILDTLGKMNDNRTRAAEMLGISIRTLRNKLKEYESRAS
ncbi:MAG: helix-turn-helix domain-containing protein, partial [Nitrospinota bacterium]